MFTLHWTDDVVMPMTATVVRSDGLVVWNDGNGVHQLRVGEDGIEWMRAQLDATGLLDAPGNYEATLRPGAEPPGRGVTGYRFDIARGDALVTVLTGSAGDYEPEFWIVPPAMTVLGDLAARIRDADGWIPPDLVEEPASPYLATAYLLHVTFRQGPNGPRSQDADVDDVQWPFPSGLHGVGVVLPDAERGQVKRCALLTRADAEAMVAAEAGLEHRHDLSAVSRRIILRWARGHNGTAEVMLQQLLPDERTCDASAG